EPPTVERSLRPVALAERVPQPLQALEALPAHVLRKRLPAAGRLLADARGLQLDLYLGRRDGEVAGSLRRLAAPECERRARLLDPVVRELRPRREHRLQRREHRAAERPPVPVGDLRVAGVLLAWRELAGSSLEEDERRSRVGF